MAETKRRTHHSVPMTYVPKLDAVFDGRCKQTIRLGRRYAEGDTVLFFEWSGRPYRSKWGRRKEVTLVSVVPIQCGPQYIDFQAAWPTGRDMPPWERTAPWNSELVAKLAQCDFIDPPTGLELKRVLEGFHGPLGRDGVKAQILLWEICDE